MAQTQSTSTLSPLRITPGADVLAADLLAVVQQQNWSMGHRPECCVSCDVAAPSRATGASWVEVRRGWLYPLQIADSVTLECEATCTINAGDDIDVRVTIGGQAVTINFTATGSATDTIAIASIVTGVWTVEIKTNTGSAGDSTLDRIRIQALAVTSSLPDPVND